MVMAMVLAVALRCRILLGLVLAILSGAIFAADVQEGWYIGTFRAEWTQGDNVTEFMVNCVNLSTCEVAIQPDAPKPQQPIRKVSLQVRRIGDQLEQVVNNNLDTARSAVKRDPSLYSHPDLGALLRALRPLLESGKRLGQCVDLSRDSDQSLVFCRPTGSEPSMPVLLLTTMNSACVSSLPFCAYYFVPMSGKEASSR